MQTKKLRAPLCSTLFAGGVAVYCATGCVSAPEPAGTRTEDAAHDPTQDPVASLTEGLYACGVSYVRSSHAYERLSCACPPGLVRDYFNVWSAGVGSCHAIGWTSPAPTDCSVDVEVSPGSFPGDTVYCTVTVDAKSPGAGCEGHCGGLAAGGDCYCDEHCEHYGDCCSDHVRVCRPTESCVNRCGGSAPDGCYCDEPCEHYGDCCADHWAVCP